MSVVAKKRDMSIMASVLWFLPSELKEQEAKVNVSTNTLCGRTVDY